MLLLRISLSNLVVSQADLLLLIAPEQVRGLLHHGHVVDELIRHFAQHFQR